jgi:hypothetical protein
MQAKMALAEAEDIENLRAVRLSKSMHTDVVLMAEVGYRRGKCYFPPPPSHHRGS